jgi:hypothetical protein
MEWDDSTFKAPPRDQGGAFALVVISDDKISTHVLPPSGSIVVGRAAEADVCVPRKELSRRHFKLDIGDSLTVTDLGSTNGLSLRGRKLGPGEALRLEPGDVIEAGPVMILLQRTASVRPPADVTEVHGPAAAADGGVVVIDPRMCQLWELARRVSRSSISVLLLGETGVGKEVFAEAIHKCSTRAQAPLVKVNCAALSETLIESELFGHERGAFTGAAATKPRADRSRRRRHGLSRRGRGAAAGTASQALARRRGADGTARGQRQVAAGRCAFRVGDEPRSARLRGDGIVSRRSLLSPGRRDLEHRAAARAYRRDRAAGAHLPASFTTRQPWRPLQHLA